MDMKHSTRMLLTALTPHPMQSVFYGDANTADDESFAADLRKRGQLDPIVVMPEDSAALLPGGTILDGCRRARSMKANGETEAMVVVRHDLKDADAATVEAEFIRYNFHRRQLHPLDKARLAKRLYDLERNRPSASFSSREKLEVRDRVGKILGMSGKNLERYMRVLETPVVIQSAVRDRRLKLELGARIAALAKTHQKEIADAIVGLTDTQRITEIVGAYIELPDSRYHRKPNDAARSFAVALDRGLEDLRDRVHEVGAGTVRRKLDTFRQAHHVIATLIKKADPDAKPGDQDTVSKVPHD